MTSVIGRLARAGLAITRCGLLGWASTVAWKASEAPDQPQPWELIFLAGSYGLALWLGAALVLVPCSFLAAESLELQADFGRRCWLQLAAAGVGMLALFPVLRLLAQWGMPRQLAYSHELATASAAYGSWALAGLGAWFTWRRWLPERGFPFWTLAPLYLAARWLAAESIQRALPDRDSLCDLALLVVLCLCANGIARRLTRRWLRLLWVSWAASVALLCAYFDRRPAAKAMFAGQFPGPASIVAAIGSCVDFDADGASAWLGGGDCDDFDPKRSPFALEIVANGIDDNCQGGDLATAQPTAPMRATPNVEQRSLVLITVDSVRADMLNTAHMPRLSEFAQAGAVFPRAYAAAPYTTDSLRSMMTGEWVMNIAPLFGVNVGAEPALAERLQAAGYDTSLVLHRWWDEPDGWTGYRGFAHVLEAGADLHDAYRDVSGPRVTERALAELHRLSQQQRPFFLWIHYLDPHAEYVARPGTPYSGRSDAHARYAQEVWSTDRELGRLFDAMQSARFLERGLCVVHSDHGELIDDQGRTGHALWLDEDVLRVVLALRGAGVPAGRYTTRVRLVDLYPTLLGLSSGITAPSVGSDLSPIWQGSAQRDRDVIVYSSYAGTRQGAILQGDYKLLLNYQRGSAYLYDLAADPGAHHNLIGLEPRLFGKLRTTFSQITDQSMNDVVLRRRARELAERDCANGNMPARLR